MFKPTPKLPPTMKKHREIQSARIENGLGEIPESGVSYNPSQEAHARLLELAVGEELGRLREEEEEAERVKVLGGVIEGRKIQTKGEFAEGMKVGPGEIDSEEDSGSDEETASKPSRARKEATRKTQFQRNRALRLREEAKLEKIEKRQRKLEKAVGGAKTLRKAEEKRVKALQEKERFRNLVRKQKERMGFEGGEKVGKYRVAKGAVDVQLGEDLAETLRQIKVSLSLSLPLFDLWFRCRSEYGFWNCADSV